MRLCHTSLQNRQPWCAAPWHHNRPLTTGPCCNWFCCLASYMYSQAYRTNDYTAPSANGSDLDHTSFGAVIAPRALRESIAAPQPSIGTLRGQHDTHTCLPICRMATPCSATMSSNMRPTDTHALITCFKAYYHQCRAPHVGAFGECSCAHGRTQSKSSSQWAPHTSAACTHQPCSTPATTTAPARRH
jgi:hypothetical protein